MSLTILLPILCGLAAVSFPGIAKRDSLAGWQNGIIAGVLVAGCSAATVWAGGQITNNVVEDWAIFTATYSALLAGPMAPLDSYLQSALNLPFLKPPAQPTSTQTVTTRAYTPTGAAPPAPQVPGVPPRASAQPPTGPSAS